MVARIGRGARTDADKAGVPTDRQTIFARPKPLLPVCRFDDGGLFVLVQAGTRYLKLSWSYTHSPFCDHVRQWYQSDIPPAYEKVTMHLYPSVKQDSTNPVMLDDPALASRVHAQSLVCFYALVSTSKQATELELAMNEWP